MNCAFSTSLTTTVFSQRSMGGLKPPTAGRLRRAKPSSPAQHRIKKLYLHRTPLRVRGTRSFSNPVSYSDRLTCCDARCLTRCHLASVSDSCHFFRTSQTCTCGGYTSCSCRRAHACSSGTVFVTVTVDRGGCADQLNRRRGYARPLSEADLDRRENMVAVNADALVRLTRAVLPAISPTPLRYRLPLWSSTTATAIADRPARANYVLPYRRGQYTQYGWAAMGLRRLSWMISTVHDESRTIPPRRRCARPTSRFAAAKSAPAGAAGHPGQGGEC